MVKKGLFPIVFLLFLPTVLPLTEDSLYSGTVHDGKIVNAGNFEFQFQVASEGGVLIKYGAHTTAVMEDDCKYRDNLHFCVGNISFAYRNVTIWKDVYQAVVDIWIIKGELEITRNIEKTKLLIGETSEVEVFLDNIGSNDVQNITYKDSYPSSIRITNIEGCSLNGNNIEWSGDLKSNVKNSCSYTLVGLESVKHNSKAEASYFDGVSAQNAYSDEVEIEVQNYSLQVKTYLNKDKIEIGNSVNLSLALENINENQEIDVLSFKINVPPNLKILKKSRELTEKGQTLSWRGNIGSEEKKNFTMELSTKRTGNVTIYLEEQYKVGGFTRKFTKPIDLEIYCDCPMIKHQVSDKFVPGEENDFKVYIFNPSYENKFNDIKIDIFTNIPNADKISKAYSVLDKRKNIALFNKKIMVPEKEVYYYNVSISYKSDYGQYFKERKGILLGGGVFESEEIIEQTSETSKVESKSGEEAKPTEPTTEKSKEKKVMLDFSKIKDKKRPLMIVLVALVLLFIISFAIGRIKNKKRKKEIEQHRLAPLYTFLFLIAAISLFFLIPNSPAATGFAVYKPDVEFIKDNLPILGAMLVLFVSLLLVIYRKEPFRIR